MASRLNAAYSVQSLGVQFLFREMGVLNRGSKNVLLPPDPPHRTQLITGNWNSQSSKASATASYSLVSLAHHEFSQA